MHAAYVVTVEWTRGDCENYFTKLNFAAESCTHILYTHTCPHCIHLLVAACFGTTIPSEMS